MKHPLSSTPDENEYLPLAEEVIEPCRQCRAVFPPSVMYRVFFATTGFCSPACKERHDLDPKRHAEPRRGME